MTSAKRKPGRFRNWLPFFTDPVRSLFKYKAIIYRSNIIIKIFYIAAIIIHQRGVIGATKAGFRKLKIFTDSFLANWRADAEQPLKPAPVISAQAPDKTEKINRRDSRRKQRRQAGLFNVLLFSPVPSHPRDHGNRNSVFHLAATVQNFGHSLYFGLEENCGYDEDSLAEMRSTWDFFHLLPFCPKPVYPWNIPFDAWFDDRLGIAVRDLCLERDIDVVICSYVWQSKMLEYLPAGILKIIDTHDRMSDRYEMLKKNALPLEFFSCSQKDEANYLKRADMIFARRLEEAEFFNSLTSSGKATVIAHLEPPAPIEKNFGSLRHIGLLASENIINFEICRNFIECFSSRPEALESGLTIQIGGKVCNYFNSNYKGSGWLSTLPYVKLLGFIDNLNNFYEGVDLMIAPVTLGTGINVKTVQAMCFGAPLCATEFAVKGIETGNTHHAHQSIEELTADIFWLRDNPDELDKLAAVSRAKYSDYYQANMRRFSEIFIHEKLRA